MSQHLLPEQWEIIRLTVVITSLFSMIGLLLIIFTFCKISSMRKKPTFRFVIYLCISDFLWSLTGVLVILGNFDNYSTDYILNLDNEEEGEEIKNPPSIPCKIAAFTYYYSYLTTFFWTQAFAANLYCMVVKHIFLLQNKEKIIIGLCYGIPIPICIALWFTNSYGPSEGLGCILRRNLPGPEYLLIDISTLFIPFGFTLFFNIYCFFRVYLFMKAHFVSAMVSKWIRTILLYPLILIVCWSLQVIYYLYYDITKNEPFLLVFFSSVLVKLQGFLNFLVYGMNETVKKNILAEFCNKKKSKRNDSSNMTKEINTEAYAETLASTNNSIIAKESITSSIATFDLTLGQLYIS